MRIVFGWHLDGATCPETTTGAAAVLGEVVAGPMTLLDLVETELGLGGPRIAAAERVACWQARMAARDHDGSFYHRSFATDPWATARAVLAWRDELVAAGWNGQIAGGGARLDILAELEAATSPALPPGSCDRLRGVLAAVERHPGLDLKVETVGDPALLPVGWRRLLAALAAAGVAIRPVAAPVLPAGPSDLHRLQAVLGGAPAEPLAGDGSVVVLTAGDPWQAAAASAAWLAAGDNAGLVLIRGGEATLLDQACHNHGLPRPGAGTPSRWRSALQVLPLAFEARWAPLDPQRLLELLTLPRGPVPGSIAAIFADALRDQPGIGGPAWQAAWRAAEDRRRRQLGESVPAEDAEDIERDLARDLESWRGWLEGAVSDPVVGMPVAEALATCRRVLQWAAVRAGLFDDELLAAAASQASACEAAIRNLSVERLPRVQIRRILNDVIGDGIVAGDAGAEAAPWTRIDHPGRLWAPADTVLWWGFADPGHRGAVSPWSAPEVAALAAAGIPIDPPERAVAREAEAWRRPVLHARRRLILVQPRCAAGEASERHPLWHEMVGLLGGTHRLAPVTVDAALLFGHAAPAFGGRVIRRAVGEPCAPPSPRPSWQVAPGLIGLRPTESATSLTTLFGCPLAWVLTYPARLRAGALIHVPDDNRVVGSLAHAIVETLFRERSEWTAAEAGRRAAELFEAELPRRAATLLLPGRLVDRAEARDRIAAAVERLVGLLAGEGLRFDAAEAAFSGHIDGHPFAGTVDLLVRDDDGRRLILDLKWARRATYRRDEIAAGQAVQLAAYAALVPDCGRDAAGYFMLRQGQLLFAGGQPFADHRVAAAATLAQVWAACVATWRADMAMLGAGIVPAAGLAEELADGLHALKPPCRFCDFAALCGAPRG